MIATYDISNTMHPYNLSMHTVSQNAHGMHTAVAHGTGDCINDDVFIDPCMGSGHILVYAFDVLMSIYESQGYTARDAAKHIVEKNIYGLELDKRAYQLAYFALMMKGRQYDRRFLTRNVKPNLAHFQDISGIQTAFLTDELKSLVLQLKDCDTLGSLVEIKAGDGEKLDSEIDELSNSLYISNEDIEHIMMLRKILLKKYDVVVTNPPYMGSSGMSAKLSEFLKKNYPDSKSDLFAVFIEKGNRMANENGYNCMVTMQSWMFLSSFEKMRVNILNTKTITNLMHMENMVMGIAFGTAVTVFKSCRINGYKGTYNHIKIQDVEDGVPKEFPVVGNRFAQVSTDNFSKIPGSPVAYWVSGGIINAFSNESLYQYSQSPSQNVTGNNGKYVRKHWEIDKCKIGGKDSWIFYAKGGGYRKWWGNLEDVVNWTPEARFIYQYGDGKHASQIINSEYWYKKGITWGLITSALPSFRIMPEGATYDKGGSTIIVLENVYNFVLGLLNSKVYLEIVTMLNPTLNFQVKDVRSMPLVLEHKDKIECIVLQCVTASKNDWDSFETSWNFKHHPLIPSRQMKLEWQESQFSHTRMKKLGSLQCNYKWWENECNDRFNKLKANEEESNRIFIDIYGLQDELTPEVDDKDVTVRKADLQRDIKSLISYAVGCMFGRYSLDVDGLAYAGGEFSEQWVVISGQCYRREVVERYVSQELSRAYSLAEIDGFGDGNLQAGQTVTQRGVICTFRPNEESGCINSVQYRRGTTAKLYEGIQELSLDCQRFQCGIADTVYDLCSPEILNAISSGDCIQLVGRGWKDADCIDWQTIHYSLTTNHYSADKDNVIPITDEEYLEDDIVGLFCAWLKKVYGSETLEENLDFIANALGNAGNTSREVIRNYFLKDFFKDHCKIYQKRPIYWLFDSGKQNGFKALIYLHRYTQDTVGNLRVDYLHRMQHIYESEINRMQDMVDNSTNARESAAATKRKEKLQKQLKECREYDEKIGHLALSRIALDLDDGVKVNYEKVQTASDGKKYQVLAKV
jgi:hypothetical protein